MCGKQAIVCIPKNKIPLPLEEAKTAQGDAAFMKHLTKPLDLYFLSSQIFIISQNCCKSEETITISRILAFWSEIYTLHSNVIIEVKKIKCTAVLIQAKTVLHLHNCPQDSYSIISYRYQMKYSEMALVVVWHWTDSCFMPSCALFKCQEK